MEQPVTTFGFTLNGREVRVSGPPRRSLLSALREDFGLVSLKAGCSPQGVCGCCVALVNGKPRITCTLAIKTTAGKVVETLESLDPALAGLYAEAFSEAGGSQCGYCTPGIVTQTHALLARSAEPTDAEISRALKMHICRCTGWQGIRRSIHLAATLRRVAERRPRAARLRESERGAMLGLRPTIDDLTRPGLLFGALVWTPLPRCRISGIDADDARQMPGVVSICTADDLPGERLFGVRAADRPALIAVGEETACAGDVLALVAARSPAEARAAADAVKITHAELPALTDPEAALADPRQVVAQIERSEGDVAAALSAAAHRVTETFHTSMVDPAFLEPDASLAVPDATGGLIVYSCGQRADTDHAQLCSLLGLPPEKLRVVLLPSGGAFGGRLELSAQPHAALLAMKTGRPVRVSLTMAEALRIHAKRHPFRLRCDIGADDEGRLSAVSVDLLADTGGYPGLGEEVLDTAARHALGAYAAPTVSVSARLVRTHNPSAGAIRGGAVGPVTFAIEGCLDRLAEQLGMDPLELRRRNLSPVLREEIGPVLDALAERRAAALAQGRATGVALGVQTPPPAEVVVELRAISPTELHVVVGGGGGGGGPTPPPPAAPAGGAAPAPPPGGRGGGGGPRRAGPARGRPGPPRRGGRACPPSCSACGAIPRSPSARSPRSRPPPPPPGAPSALRSTPAGEWTEQCSAPAPRLEHRRSPPTWRSSRRTARSKRSSPPTASARSSIARAARVRSRVACTWGSARPSASGSPSMTAAVPRRNSPSWGSSRRTRPLSSPPSWWRAASGLRSERWRWCPSLRPSRRPATGTTGSGALPCP